MNQLLKPLSYLLVVFFLTGWALAKSSSQAVVEVGRFSQMDLQQWDEKSFHGNTQYSLQQIENRYVLRAKADRSASALYKRIKVDLTNTPYMNWSWSIDAKLAKLDEQSKDGDDYAARIYVVIKTGIAPWNTRALNYVWSSNIMPPTQWPNAFTDKAIMIPLRTRKDASNQWQTEKVNIRADIKKYLGFDSKQIAGVAIMTDTDNSGNSAAASYGDIYFSEQ